MEAVPQGRKDRADLGGIHVKDSVHAPERIGGTPGRQLSPPPLKNFRRRPSDPEGGIGSEGTQAAQANPARELRSEHFPQGPVDEGMGMEMVVAIDEPALQSGGLEEFPLPDDLPAGQLAGASEEADAPSRPGGRGAPGPPFDGGRLGVVEMEMPADLERRVGSGQRNGLACGDLSCHQCCRVQSSKSVTSYDGMIDLRPHPKVVRDENDLVCHIMPH